MASTGFEGGQFTLPGLVSGELALSASQYRFVQVDTQAVGSVIRAATAGQQGLIGVLQDKPQLVGDPVNVCGGGITKVEAGVAITKGARLTTDASGRAITAAATAAHHVYGYALEAASAAGSIIAMAFSYHGPAVNAS
jgi:hypothetical protein